MSGENEQIEEEKKADGGKIKIPAHLMAAKQTPVAKPAWMQRLASAKPVGNKYQQAPVVTVHNDAADEDNAELAAPPRQRFYKVKNIHTVLPPSTSTDGAIKEASDHAPPPEPEPATMEESTKVKNIHTVLPPSTLTDREITSDKVPPPSPQPQTKAESIEKVQPTKRQSQSQLQSEPSQSRESEILDKPTSLNDEAPQHESQPEMVEQVLHSSGSSNQDIFEDKTEDGSGTVEEVISSDEDSVEESIEESADSDSSGDQPGENSTPVAAANTLDPVATTPQPAVAPVMEHSREVPSSKSNVITSTPSPTRASRGQPPSRVALSKTPASAPKPAPAPVTPAESPIIVSMIPKRPSAADADANDSFVPPRPIPGAVNVSSTYKPTIADPMALPKRPSLTLTDETEEPPSLLRASTTKPQGAAVDSGIRNTAANYRRDNYDHDDDDDDDSDDWMYPQRHEDDSSWVNPSHPIQPERKQHVTEELKKKSVDLFPENGLINQRMVHLKSIEEESNLKDFDYDPKVGFIVDPHLRGGDGQTISETSFSEISKMDLSAKIMETAVPRKDLDVWAMPSQEGTYRALGKLDTHKDGKDYRFSYIAQPHTHSTSSYADVVRERYFPKEDNDYWAAPAREAPPELPIHISREGTIQSGPADENESWLPPEDDPNQPPVDQKKIYAPTLAEEKYSEARSVVSEGSDWIGRGVVAARVDFAGTVTDGNMDSFEWNPAKEPSLAPSGNHNEDDEDETDDSEIAESEALDDELEANALHATPRPPSPPAALQGKRASESAPQSRAAGAESEAGYDYSSSGRLKFDLTPTMIMIEGNADKGNSKSGGNYDKVQLRNRCYLFVCFFLIVLLGGVACIVIFVVDPFNKNNDTSPESVPTMEPTRLGEDNGPTEAPSPTATFFPGPAQNPSTPTSSAIDENVLLDFLSKISSDNGDALKDSASPQYAAMQWLLSSANIGIYEDATLIQRYALATFYYATGGEQWVDSTNWLTDVSECEWYTSSDMGSICDMDENLLELNLMGNSLTGSLPPELNLLSNSLTTLHLGDNKIGGQIPAELSELWHLETLQLSQNQFRGTIPTAIGTMGNLKTLFVYQNSLRSSIPTQLGQLTTLKELDLGANRLTGGIPTEIGALTTLISLSLYGNDLTGTIPSQIALLTNLQVLYLDSNDLGPTLPESICSDLNLDEFWSDCDEIGGCACCTKCCQDGVTCA